MKRNLVVAVAAVTVVLAWSAASHSQEGKSKPTPAELEAQMKIWMELAQPGKQHEKLRQLAGEWDVVSLAYMAGADGPATESKGKSTITAVLGGRFIQENFQGEFQMPGPDGKMQTMKFEGQGMLGYDNQKKMYVGTWADTMGTMMMSYKGVDAGDQTVYYSEMDDPAMGFRMFKFVRKIESKDKFTYAMFDVTEGEEITWMKMTYTRRK